MHVSYSANLAMETKKPWTRPKVIHVNEVRRPVHVPVDVAPTAISAIFNQPMAPVPPNETLHTRPHGSGGSGLARVTGDMAAMAKQAQAAARRGSSEVCACGGGSRGGCVRVCVVAPAPCVLWVSSVARTERVVAQEERQQARQGQGRFAVAPNSTLTFARAGGGARAVRERRHGRHYRGDRPRTPCPFPPLSQAHWEPLATPDT